MAPRYSDKSWHEAFGKTLIYPHYPLLGCTWTPPASPSLRIFHKLRIGKVFRPDLKRSLPEWVKLCSYKIVLLLKPRSQCEQIKLYWPLCLDLWKSKACFPPKTSPHSSQIQPFSPVWLLSWICKQNKNGWIKIQYLWREWQAKCRADKNWAYTPI